MPSSLRAAIWLLLTLAIGGLTYETWRLAELVGRNEIATREVQREVQRELVRAQDARAAAEEERQQALAAAELKDANIARLEGQLMQSTSQLQAMAERVEAAANAAQRRHEAAAEAGLRQLKAMPAGVRQCLATLHDCLQVEGFSGLRFLRAAELDAEGLHQVEAVHTQPDGLAVEFLYAKTMQAEYDRGEQRLVLTFFEGSRVAGGERLALPKDGWQVVVAPIAGHALEARLPYLIRAVGAYADTEPSAAERRSSDLDLIARFSWLERFDRLLSLAETDEELRVQDFRGVQDGAFLGARLLATNSTGNVIYGAGCDRLAVEVDRQSGVVSLLLQGGSLRRGVAESTITPTGMRILLIGVTPEQAIETMLGMVVKK